MPHTPIQAVQRQMAAVPLEGFRWPSGIDKAVAVLVAEPADLAARYGIEFTRDLDDLDYHQLAVARLLSGRLVMFIRYQRSPHPGTTVLIDGSDALAAAWAELCSTLDLNDSDTNWRSELMGETAESA